MLSSCGTKGRNIKGDFEYDAIGSTLGVPEFPDSIFDALRLYTITMQRELVGNEYWCFPYADDVFETEDGIIMKAWYGDGLLLVRMTEKETETLIDIETTEKYSSIISFTVDNIKAVSYLYADLLEEDEYYIGEDLDSYIIYGTCTGVYNPFEIS